MAYSSDLLQGDMRHLPFASAQFDGVWANASLLHLPREDAPDVLAEIRHVIKLDGVLMASVKRGEGSAWTTAPDFGGEHRFFIFFQSDELTTLLAAEDFVVMAQLTENTWNAFHLLAT